MTVPIATKTRRKLVALAQNADPQRVGGLHAFTWRGRIDRRAAGAAERLHARTAALGRGLYIDRRLADDFESRASDRDGNPKGSAGCGLAIGAMTDLRLFQVGFRLDLDRAAGASAINFHQSAPFDCSAVCSIAAISASDKPKWWPISCTSTCLMMAPSVSSCSAQ